MVSVVKVPQVCNFFYLLAVRDTVQSTGVLINRILPFTDSNTDIKRFRHALSLDEVCRHLRS